MCGRLVNLDTVARVLAEYYHLKTETQLAALDEALSRVPAETVGKELFGISEQLNDLISRQAAIEVIDAVFPVNPTKSEYAQGLACGVALAKTYVEQLPSAEPERKRGKWIDAVLPNDSGGLQVQVCDQCNTFFPLAYTGGGHNFCPNCGADMREEEQDG